MEQMVYITEFDDRLGKIPRYSGLKLFKHGLDNIKRFTAKEFWLMMHQLVFVVDGIINKLHKPDYTTYNRADILILSHYCRSFYRSSI